MKLGQQPFIERFHNPTKLVWIGSASMADIEKLGVLSY